MQYPAAQEILKYLEKVGAVKELENHNDKGKRRSIK